MSPDDKQADDAAHPDEHFMQRWSRRKHEAETGKPSAAPEPAGDDPAHAASAPAEPVQREPAATAVAPTEAEPPGDKDMPPLDSLGPDSDVSAFFSPRVSEDLRRAALQRLFHLPEFNVTDGLDVYNEDFRHFIPLGDVVTADMRLRAERMQRRLARLAGANSAPEAEMPETERPGTEAADENPPARDDSSGDHDEPDSN